MKEVWAYKCELLKTNTGRMSLQPPVLGVIDGHSFIPIGKTGNLIQSQKVNRYSRDYADTYEEAKEKYNKQIKDLISYYENQIKRLENNICK